MECDEISIDRLFNLPKMRKALTRFIAATSSLIYFFQLKGLAFAQLISPPPGSVSTRVDPNRVPQTIVNGIFLLASFLAVVYLMYGGIRWITSRGDKNAVQDARRHIMSAIIGIIVVAGTFFLLNFLFTTVLHTANPLKCGLSTISLDNSGGCK